MILLIVGDVIDELSAYAISIDPNAILITNSNSNHLHNGTYYVSLGDFDTYNQFTDVLAQADKIIYYPPQRWSDSDSRGISSMKQHTESALTYFYNRIPVDNFVIDPINIQTVLDLADTRKTSDPQIWIGGGSDSHGYALDPLDRYGSILSNYFNMEVSFLTMPRASMRWISDQILRADIREGDLVVFGIVPDCRIPFYSNSHMYHVTPELYMKESFLKDLFSLDILDSDDVTLYQPLSSIHQVINVCSKLKAHLIIAGLSRLLITNHLLHLPNYVHLLHRHYCRDNFFLDLASDGSHPGPEAHQYYANEIIAKIKQLNINLC